MPHYNVTWNPDGRKRVSRDLDDVSDNPLLLTTQLLVTLFACLLAQRFASSLALNNAVLILAHIRVTVSCPLSEQGQHCESTT